MLQLHVPTLMAVVLTVNLTLSAFCMTCWYGRRDRQIYLWVCMAGAISSFGCLLIMLRGNAPEWVTIWFAQSLILTGGGLLWAGVCIFEGRKPPLGWIMAGATGWTLFRLMSPFYAEESNRMICASLLQAIYFFFIARELARGYRNEPSRGRIIACVLAASHVVACAGRCSLIFNAAGANWPREQASTWIGFFIIESIVNIVGMVLALTTMERDRAELQQRHAASTDVLTGAMNRRAFIDSATDWIELRGKDAVLLLFDLDHFKKINDTYGHASGDAALIAFAKLVNRRIDMAQIIAAFNQDAAQWIRSQRVYESTQADAAEGGDPIFGRLGGEEFACMLPHLSLSQGMAIAEDIRAEVAAMAIGTGGQSFSMTVSGSAVTTADIGHRLDMMLSCADHALYRAKDMGRNRVEAGAAEPGMQIRHYA